MADHPFDDCVARAKELIVAGADVFQKFTCQHCGARLTMDEPNKFYTHGTCDQCNEVTNIRERGMNYMLLSPGRSKERQLTIQVTSNA